MHPAARSPRFMWIETGQRNSTAPTLSWCHAGRSTPRCCCCDPRRDKHPNGLANASDVVGRHYMRHNNSAFMAISRPPNPTRFQKTLGVNDYYFRSDDWEYPLGHIQMLGKSHGDTIKAEAVNWMPWAPEMPFDEMARHSVRILVDLKGSPRSQQPGELRSRWQGPA